MHYVVNVNKHIVGYNKFLLVIAPALVIVSNNCSYSDLVKTM